MELDLEDAFQKLIVEDRNVGLQELYDEQETENDKKKVGADMKLVEEKVNNLRLPPIPEGTTNRKRVRVARKLTEVDMLLASSGKDLLSAKIRLDRIKNIDRRVTRALSKQQNEQQANDLADMLADTFSFLGKRHNDEDEEMCDGKRSRHGGGLTQNRKGKRGGGIMDNASNLLTSGIGSVSNAAESLSSATLGTMKSIGNSASAFGHALSGPKSSTTFSEMDSYGATGATGSFLRGGTCPFAKAVGGAKRKSKTKAAAPKPKTKAAAPKPKTKASKK